MKHLLSTHLARRPPSALWLSHREEEPQVCRRTDQSKFSCFCFLPWRTLAWLLSLSFCQLLASSPPSDGQSNKTEPYAGCPPMTPTITRLRPRFMMNHILSSPPEIHPQSGKQLTFFLLCEGREHLKIWKGQASRTYTSGDVSNSFYGSRLGQQWEFYIRAVVFVCVCLSGQTHPEWSRSAAFVKYDPGTMSPAAHLLSSQVYLSFSPFLHNSFPWICLSLCLRLLRRRSEGSFLSLSFASATR